MFSFDGFNNLSGALKWFLGAIIIVSPFWYLAIYFIRPDLILTTRIDIALVSTFCLTICTFISLIPLAFSLLLFHEVYKEKIATSNDSEKTNLKKNETHINKKDIWQEIDVLFIYNIIFAIILSLLSIYFIKNRDVDSFKELIRFIVEIVLYAISISFLLQGQVAFRGGCLLASIYTIISIGLGVSTYFIFN